MPNTVLGIRIKKKKNLTRRTLEAVTQILKARNYQNVGRAPKQTGQVLSTGRGSPVRSEAKQGGTLRGAGA